MSLVCCDLPQRRSFTQVRLMGPASNDLWTVLSLTEGQIQGEVHLAAALSLPLPPLFGF